MSDAQKLQYLKAFLQGEPLSQIKHLKLCDANFPIAWNSLENQYNDILLSTQTLQGENSASLKDLRNRTNEFMMSLKAMGRSVDKWDDILYAYSKIRQSHTKRLGKKV